MSKKVIPGSILILMAFSICGCHPDTVQDFDGNRYDVVRIGRQYWMKENLRSTHYADGTPIPLVENKAGWLNLKVDEKAYCFYKNDSSLGEVYGALYNWAAATNGYNGTGGRRGIQGVCPDGWHIPSDKELIRLEWYLGMDKSESEKDGARGTTEGGKLKEAGILHWDDPNEGATNESGFAGLPGGYRNGPGTGNIDFNHMHSTGFIWSSTTSPIDQTMAICRSLYFSDPRINRDAASKAMGYSVRCIKN